MKKIKKEDFPSRLRQIMNDRNISQAELSKITGITASSISDWLNRKYDAKQDKIDKIASSLNISPAWLLGYDVPMDKNIIDKSDLIEDKHPKEITLSEKEKQLLHNYNSTTEFGQKRIMTTSEEMVELYPIIPSREEILQRFIDKDIAIAAVSGKSLNSLSEDELQSYYLMFKDILNE